MQSDAPTDDFLKALTAAQSSLYAYILSLLPDRVVAQDVLQDVNLTIWQKQADFEPGTHFMAWGSRIAYFHVLSQRRKMSRDRLVFNEEVFSYLAERQAERAPEVDRRARLLKGCLEQLTPAQRTMMEARYSEDGSVERLALSHGKKPGAISQSLYRIRRLLLDCVEMKLLGGEAI